MKVKLTISLDDEVLDFLKQIAAEDHKPLSQWITDAVVADHRKRAAENRTN